MATENDEVGMDLGENTGPLDHDQDGKKGGSKKKADRGRTWIVLEENEEIPPTGLFLGHNGNPFMLLPGTPALVPDYLLDVLDNAVMSMPTRDPNTMQVIAYRERQRYPYRRVSAPKEA